MVPGGTRDYAGLINCIAVGLVVRLCGKQCAGSSFKALAVFDPHGYHTDTDSPTLSRAAVITPGCNVHGESDRLPSRGMRLLDPAAQQHVLTSSHA